MKMSAKHKTAILFMVFWFLKPNQKIFFKADTSLHNLA